MVYNYVHSIKRQINHEVNYCKGTAQTIWDEVNFIKTVPARNRTTRQAGYDEGVTGGSATVGGGSCDGCCLPGVAGPTGTPGAPGRPGKPGAPGRPGNPGR